jgi:hypothetical protein
MYEVKEGKMMGEAYSDDLRQQILKGGRQRSSSTVDLHVVRSQHLVYL